MINQQPGAKTEGGLRRGKGTHLKNIMVKNPLLRSRKKDGAKSGS